MRTEPVTIDGLAGPVVVSLSTLTGRSSLTVGGVPVPGTRRGDYVLPTANGGTVPAKVRASLLDPYPTIEIAGVKHRTGPAMPALLRVLSLLPIVLVVGGAIGGVLGVAGIAANVALARNSQPTAVKALMMVLILAGAVVAYLIVTGTFLAATS